MSNADKVFIGLQAKQVEYLKQRIAELEAERKPLMVDAYNCGYANGADMETPYTKAMCDYLNDGGPLPEPPKQENQNE